MNYTSLGQENTDYFTIPLLPAKETKEVNRNEQKIALCLA